MLNRIRQSATFVALYSCLFLVGCSSDAPSSETAEDRAEIQPLSTEQFAALLESSRGEVVLVNLWATWCVPCLKEIPELVELEKELSASGFRVVGISLDDTEDAEKVRSFRDEWFPEFRTYHVSDDDWFTLVSIVEPQWNSVLPTSFVLDRSGALSITLTGGKDYQTFAAAVEPLL